MQYAHQSADGDRPLVLIVDDDLTITELVRASMVKAGFRPIIAHDGQEGLEMARISKPKAVVLDWMMPEKSGIDVLKELKADAQSADIPVMMLTSKRMTHDVMAAVQAGASEYVVKPFEISEFITRFHKMLYQFGDKKIIDFNKFRAKTVK